uniref:SCP domain-containing protein n=1 Tax=Populus alba TaxID=43335 RepID=A0A4U5Q7G7_POPAL|nr:hypothetical protein D5086_0000126880 [Populus alba]
MHTRYATITIFILLISSTHAVITRRPNPYLRAANQFMAPQNAARASLRIRPLVWDANLARYAQSYCNQRRYDCDLKHSNGPYGENIFWGSGSGWTPAQAAAAWVSERKWYDYWSNSCAEDQECGHYTQIGTAQKELGVLGWIVFVEGEFSCLATMILLGIILEKSLTECVS